ncbi:MAG: DUF2520 domain-containing protein [Acidobacteriota bacterium]|jgi:predicted short-subunit dehydrogenase-like oxidoreductase (DUF2520 family)
MNFDPWVGLIAAGPVSPALARLPDLHTQLGPVAAASLRVASRIANQLKAGQPARIEQMQSASLVLVSGPEGSISSLLDLVRSAPWDWQSKALVLLDTRLEGRDVEDLAARGAAVATLDPIDGFGEVRFCVDGDAAALRQLKRFLGALRTPYFTVEQGKKQVFSAGLAFTGTLATPLLAAAVECFRNAGLDPKQAAAIAERTLLHTLRAWQKAGRQGWTGVLPQRDLESVRRQLAALAEENTVLWAYFAETAHMALELFGHDADWLRALDQDAGPEEPPAKGRGAAAGGDAD